MPFRSDKASGIARGLKKFLKPENARQREPEPETKLRQKTKLGQKEEVESKKRELSQIRREMDAAKDGAARSEQLKRVQKKRLELLGLRKELRAAREGRAEVGLPATGALPDFVVIGAVKGGTTSFYHLLSQHPLVEPAASKELRFFDVLFEEGVEWYRQCFPAPRWENGRRTITGEASPGYMSHPLAPERMAEVTPRARLIVLLRNPVDRAYSHYRMVVKKGGEPLSFEEAIEAEGARVRGEREKMLRDKRYFSRDHLRFSYLSLGVYVDQLLRWSEFFAREQMLVLKSEDFFEAPAEFFEPVLGFLGLPHWEPEKAALGGRRNAGRYEGRMDPATRRRLEEYFAPHNQKLYDYLGRDLGW